MLHAPYALTPIRTDGTFIRTLTESHMLIGAPLYNCPLPANICGPGALSSIRISTDIVDAIIAHHTANIRYINPISFAEVLHIHRLNM